MPKQMQLLYIYRYLYESLVFQTFVTVLFEYYAKRVADNYLLTLTYRKRQRNAQTAINS